MAKKTVKKNGEKMVNKWHKQITCDAVFCHHEIEVFKSLATPIPNKK
jgi:hypothetical protein